MQVMDADFLSIAEAAARVGLSRDTVESWIRRGLLTPVRRRPILVAAADVDRVAAARRRPGNPQFLQGYRGRSQEEVSDE